MKRLFDLGAALCGLLLLCPAFVLISLWVMFDSRGGVFYRQVRVGRGGRDFGMFKFRTMHTGADRKGLLTVGGRDPRVTRAGYHLRRLKLDELPQLINVLLGDMSLVGPRPEVRRYVDLYTPEQRRVLDVRPGITDLASIAYSNENEMLAQQPDPERHYIEVIMPDKIRLNLQHINDPSALKDLKVIWQTGMKVFG
jgi:lipopolysaccharide/colanic/teichoic acid biosynthesis glycosyltransferase